MKEINVRIKPEFLLWSLFIGVVVLAAYQLRSVIILFFISFILYSGFRPIVNKLDRRGIPRLISVLFIYTIIIFALLLVGALVVDTFVSQFNQFVQNIPDLVRNTLTSLNQKLPNDYEFLDENSINNIANSISQTFNSENVDLKTLGDVFNFISTRFDSIGTVGISVASSIVEVIFNLFVVLVVTAYLLVRRERIYAGLLNFIPKKRSDEFEKIFHKIEIGLGEWFIGQLVVMTIIGVFSFIAVIIPRLIGVESYELYKFAVLLGIFAGLLEAFPNIGPTLTSVLILLFAIGTGESIGIIIYVSVAFIIVQQIEGLIVTPNIMRRIAHLDPIVVILGIVAGFQLYGVLGALISLPFIVTIKIIAQEVNDNLKKNKINKEDNPSMNLRERLRFVRRKFF